MKLSRIFVINLLFVVGMLALSIWAWRELPPNVRIPTRFDFDGKPIAYMGKVGGLFLLPLLTLSIPLTDLIILPKTEPNQNNIKRSKRAYTAISIATVVFMAIVHVTIVLAAVEQTINTSNVIAIALGILMMIIGNYLTKIRRNYSFGFRTRWTLSSDLAWHKTHRWASWLTVIHGVAFIVASLSNSTTLIKLSLISFAVVSIIVLPVYSYWLWKSDSNRLTE